MQKLENCLTKKNIKIRRFPGGGRGNQTATSVGEVGRILTIIIEAWHVTRKIIFDRFAGKRERDSNPRSGARPRSELMFPCVQLWGLGMEKSGDWAADRHTQAETETDQTHTDRDRRTGQTDGETGRQRYGRVRSIHT